MKSIADICAYCIWFLRVCGWSCNWLGLPQPAPEEQIAMLVVGLLLAGVIVLATSAVVTEILWQAVKGIMHLPDDWHGSIAED